MLTIYTLKTQQIKWIKSSSTGHGRLTMFDQRLVISGHLTDLKNTGEWGSCFILSQPDFNL